MNMTIKHIIEASRLPRQLMVPPGMSFDQLNFAVCEKTGKWRYDMLVLAEFCAGNAISADTLRGRDWLVADLIVCWHALHVAQGGAPDPDMAAEMDRACEEMANGLIAELREGVKA